MSAGTITDVAQTLAEEALDINAELTALQDKLETKKLELRELANGSKLNIEVPGKGRIDVSSPRQGSERIVFVIDENRVAESPGLKELLVERGVAKEEKKVTAPAQASVKIKNNI